MTRDPSRVARGDWQTPLALARQVVAAITDVEPATIVEPTCGAGAFLQAAAERWPRAALRGFELHPEHLAAARRLPGASVFEADLFRWPWELELAHPGPVLVLGNPPWVTSATLGALPGAAQPGRRTPDHIQGLDLRTGRSTFDVAEWAILRLLDAGATHLALLCKTGVARRIAEHVSRQRLPLAGRLHDIDARALFRANVDAALLQLHPAPLAPLRWPWHPTLDSPPTRALGVVDGHAVADVDALTSTRHLAGACRPAWRSGVKHDCAEVFELDAHGHNAVGARADVEPEHLYPLLKGADLAQDRPIHRQLLLPQRTLAEPTDALAHSAPRTWAWLQAHRARLDARRSRIYRGRPPFSVFGVGPYSFAPWKVAIAGLYKELRFTLVGPHEGRPVLFDDTCYLLPFNDEDAATVALERLRSPAATAFLQARIFWDDKRPVRKELLQQLDLDRLAGR